MRIFLILLLLCSTCYAEDITANVKDVATELPLEQQIKTYASISINNNLLAEGIIIPDKTKVKETCIQWLTNYSKDHNISIGDINNVVVK